MIGSKVVERINQFTYLGSLINCFVLVCGKILARIQRFLSVFTGLSHFWHKRNLFANRRQSIIHCNLFSSTKKLRHHLSFPYFIFTHRGVEHRSGLRVYLITSGMVSCFCHTKVSLCIFVEYTTGFFLFCTYYSFPSRLDSKVMQSFRCILTKGIPLQITYR